jgi:hypothetical protein
MIECERLHTCMKMSVSKLVMLGECEKQQIKCEET